MEVDVFIPCFIDQLNPETGFSMVKVLEKLGVKVHYNPNQTCCGQMAFNSGFWDDARDLGVKFIRDFSNDRPIVSPSSSCTGFVRNYYEKLFYNTPWHLEYKKLREQVFEVTDFIVNRLKTEDVGAAFEARVVYHSSCASLREYRLNDEPLRLLRNVRGLELLDLKDADVCCGFGGTFAVKHEAISTAMAEQKVQNAVESGAEYIVSTDGSCLLHLESYIRRQKIDIKTMHIIDLLAEGLQQKTTT
ncbi:MAG: (Fe-S)-binding protein [Bacteroidales bacterium]